MLNGPMTTCMKCESSSLLVRGHGVPPSKISSKLPTIVRNHGMKVSTSRTLAAERPLVKTTEISCDKGYSFADSVVRIRQLDNESVEEGEHKSKHDNDDDDDADAAVEDDRSNLRKEQIRRAELKEKLSQILSNAQRLKSDHSMGAYYSLGVDFGDARTGVAISKGFAPRPIEVIELKGQRLEARLIDIAEKEGAIEFVVGLPKSSRGMENWQSNKTRCFAGRLAVLAAKRGWRVYLHDEFGTSNNALEHMIMMGSTKKSRRTKLDAYAAVALLKEYFNSSGVYAELVVPKKLELQECLCEAPKYPESDDDIFEDEDF